MSYKDNFFQIMKSRMNICIEILKKIPKEKIYLVKISWTNKEAQAHKIFTISLIMKSISRIKKIKTGSIILKKKKTTVRDIIN